MWIRGDETRRRALFAWVLFAIPAASTFGHYLAPNEDVFKGHDWGIIGAFVLALVAFGLWVPFQSRYRWSPFALLFLTLLAVAWIYQLVRTQADGSTFNISASIVLLALLLLTLKPLDKRDLRTSLLVLAYSLAVISIATLILGSIGATPSGFAVSDGGGSRIGVLEAFGYPGRWGGPFGSVNYAAPVGGLLVVIGLTLRRTHRVVLVTVGLLILVLSQGRTALVAVIAAALALALFGGRIERWKHARVIRVASGLLAVLVLILYLITVDPTINGRTTIWGNFFSLFASDPVSGIGSSGVLQFVAENDGALGFVPHTHAHSVLLDGATRYGVVFIALSLGIYGIALVMSARALNSVGSGPLALVIYVIVAGLTETTYSWMYWSTYSAVLTYAVLITAERKPSQRVIQKEAGAVAQE